MRNKFVFLSALVFAVALVAPALAEQPECTGDRHYDEEGQCCPTLSTTTTTLPDEGCPGEPPCQPVVCSTDVCVDNACTNGSVGTDGNGACARDSDCKTGTTVNLITVNRCPAFEDLVPCRRSLRTGKLTCPHRDVPRRELVPYSKAKALQNGNGPFLLP